MKIEDLREMPNGDDYTVHQAWMQFRDKAEALEQRLQLAKELLLNPPPKEGAMYIKWFELRAEFIEKLNKEGL